VTAQAKDVDAIDRVREAHVTAPGSGDVDAWAACFTADPVQMPPNCPANVGAESIRGWSGGMLTAFRAELSLAPEEVAVTGAEWAFERGAYAITLTPKAGGDSIRDAGKYVTLYERQADGGWLVARDTWNSDDPLPGERES
jgi:uncharacterized protein (TIGR02246 family)